MPTKPRPQRVAYSIPEIAEMTGRSRSTVYKWLAQGTLKAVRTSKGKQMVTAASLEKLLKDGAP